jgi:hypothetical protein
MKLNGDWWNVNDTNAAKAAASRFGITFDEYMGHKHRGEKRCGMCCEWKPANAFNKDSFFSDGLASRCRVCARATDKARYAPKPRKPRGSCARKGKLITKTAAVSRVNYLRDYGVIPDPNTLPCARCGHSGNDRGHEYHHHNGYDLEHQEDVIPLCRHCHHLAHPHGRRRKANV